MIARKTQESLQPDLRISLETKIKHKAQELHQRDTRQTVERHQIQGMPQKQKKHKRQELHQTG